MSGETYICLPSSPQTHLFSLTFVFFSLTKTSHSITVRESFYQSCNLDENNEIYDNKGYPADVWRSSYPEKLMNVKQPNNWVIKPLVPEEVYTDRTEFLDYFYRAALKAARRRTMSTVLLGTRRMGKTEIFKRVVNRLFFEQDPQAPQAVVPVYYSFRDAYSDRKDFAEKYLDNFLRYYLGFYTRNTELIRKQVSGKDLSRIAQEARSQMPFPKSVDWLLIIRREIEEDDVPFPQEVALEAPRRVSDDDDTTIVMFLDEFQNTRLPQYGFDIVGHLQEAVESPTCPHFVTGSAMSILAREIIGRGSLFGRFYSHPIESMSGYWGAELALRTARYYQADVPELMAPVIANRCGGNPFYITALVHQAAELHEPLSDETQLNKILAVDISSGFIWGELNDQVTRWIERINDQRITKWILYLAALEENERISIERIQQELKAREGKDVPLDTIRDVLVKLSRGDLIEYLEFGGWFRTIKDPILLEFLKVWGRIEVEGQNRTRVQYELQNRYQTLQRKISEYKGYLAEVFMSQVLLNGHRQTLPGRLFHSAVDVTIPWPFISVRQRARLGTGEGREIDVLGVAWDEIWVCQSKWVTGDNIGVDVLNTLMEQANVVQEDMNPQRIRMWLFAYKGLTKEALNVAHQHNILWSSCRELNEILRFLGLRELPELS